jgi:hypothetical protein
VSRQELVEAALGMACTRGMTSTRSVVVVRRNEGPDEGVLRLSVVLHQEARLRRRRADADLLDEPLQSGWVRALAKCRSSFMVERASGKPRRAKSFSSR